jgi:hypothetical protein
MQNHPHGEIHLNLRVGLLTLLLLSGCGAPGGGTPTLLVNEESPSLFTFTAAPAEAGPFSFAEVDEPGFVGKILTTSTALTVTVTSSGCFSVCAYDANGARSNELAECGKEPVQ